MRRIALTFTLLLIVAACGGEAGDTTTTTAESGTSQPGQPTTTADSVTTTTEAGGDAQFVVSGLTFGDGATVTITNVGSEPGSLDGHFLCQRPSYASLPDQELAAGESITLSVPGDLALGALTSGGGEVGLYTSSNFGSADHIISYVEWGSAGHGRSSVAGEAGIWTGFVETTDATTSMTTNNDPATSPDDWDVG